MRKPSLRADGNLFHKSCLPFIKKKKSGNFGWEFSFGKNDTCRLPFA